MSKLEILDFIDERNVIIGQASRDLIYLQHLSHRIVHIIVIEDGKIFIVNRSQNVAYLPGFYCTSAGGHVQTGENSQNAAIRELFEEIGLSGPLQHFIDFDFYHEFRIHISLFIRKFDSTQDKIVLNPEEVSSGRFYTWDEIRRLDISLCHPQMLACLEKIKMENLWV